MLSAGTEDRRFTDRSLQYIQELFRSLANVISVLHRSQSVAGPPLIFLAELMMEALLHPRGNPSGVTLTRAAMRTRSQNSDHITFFPGIQPVRVTTRMACVRRGALRAIGLYFRGAARPPSAAQLV